MTSDYKNFSVPAGNESISEECESESNAIYQYLYGDITSYIMYCVVVGLILTMGPLLCISIVLFEHFGADPQKRTILNRILSFILSNIATGSFIWGLVRILREALGLLPSLAIHWLFYFHKSIGLSIVLFAAELAMFRFLFIVVWKRMKAINDDFWMTVLAISTYLLSFYSVLADYLVGYDLEDTPSIIIFTCTEKR